MACDCPSRMPSFYSPGARRSRCGAGSTVRNGGLIMDTCTDYREQGVRVGPSAFGLGYFP